MTEEKQEIAKGSSVNKDIRLYIGFLVVMTFNVLISILFLLAFLGVQLQFDFLFGIFRYLTAIIPIVSFILSLVFLVLFIVFLIKEKRKKVWIILLIWDLLCLICAGFNSFVIYVISSPGFGA